MKKISFDKICIIEIELIMITKILLIPVAVRMRSQFMRLLHLVLHPIVVYFEFWRFFQLRWPLKSLIRILTFVQKSNFFMWNQFAILSFLYSGTKEFWVYPLKSGYGDTLKSGYETLKSGYDTLKSGYFFRLPVYNSTRNSKNHTSLITLPICLPNTYIILIKL